MFLVWFGYFGLHFYRQCAIKQREKEKQSNTRMMELEEKVLADQLIQLKEAGELQDHVTKR